MNQVLTSLLVMEAQLTPVLRLLLAMGAGAINPILMIPLPILRLLLAMGAHICPVLMSVLAREAQRMPILRLLLVMEANITSSLWLPVAMGAQITPILGFQQDMGAQVTVGDGSSPSTEGSNLEDASCTVVAQRELAGGGLF